MAVDLRWPKKNHVLTLHVSCSAVLQRQLNDAQSDLALEKGSALECALCLVVLHECAADCILNMLQDCSASECAPCFVGLRRAEEPDLARVERLHGPGASGDVGPMAGTAPRTSSNLSNLMQNWNSMGPQVTLHVACV